MVDVLFIISGCVSLLAAVYKYRDLRKAPDNRPQRALTVGLVFLGLAFLSAAPVIYTATDRLVDIPNGMRLVAHVCLVVFAGSVAQMLLHWAYPLRDAAPRARRRLLWYAATVTALTVLFIAAPVDEEAVDWTIRYGDHPLVATYLLVYVCAFGVAMAEIGRLSHRYAGFLPAGAVRAGLRVTTAGAVFGLAYCSYKAVYLAGRQIGLHAPDPVAWLGRDDVVAPLLAVPSGLLMIIGLTMPSWGPPLGRVGRRAGQYRAYRELYPLWRELFTAEPDILFDDQPPPARPWRRLGPLLERRAIEIGDGVMRLTPYCEKSAQQRATTAAERAGLSDDRRLAAVHAACISAALHDRSTGRRAADPVAPPSAKATTMQEQIAWLRLVARSYRRRTVTVADSAEDRPAVTA